MSWGIINHARTRSPSDGNQSCCLRTAVSHTLLLQSRIEHPPTHLTTPFQCPPFLFPSERDSPMKTKQKKIHPLGFPPDTLVSRRIHEAQDLFFTSSSCKSDPAPHCACAAEDERYISMPEKVVVTTSSHCIFILRSPRIVLKEFRL
ncbi:hypothetical protein AVEN_30597-1 [Araneus ventricosus]|uniref:Uncharacterized protein n=1 Tax=Araneus ventricosus TaxID=182803 RepID=A0A4Y2ENI7_ARAVE|nr:hypothetical protein AVEN_30597-1 [Araneus ventricosus]